MCKSSWSGVHVCDRTQTLDAGSVTRHLLKTGAQPTAGVGARQAQTKRGCSPNCYTHCVRVLFYKCLGSWFTASHRPTLGEKSATGTGPHSSLRRAPGESLFAYQKVLLYRAAFLVRHPKHSPPWRLGNVVLLFCTLVCLCCLVTRPWISWWGRPVWPYNADIFRPTHTHTHNVKDIINPV